ncbi:MAG: hypothetical protein IPL47_03540 [Phyllobacteriaceae bacterium]|nr:hypothetical protein [Phyllobacteriaceae bacterium]
MRDWLDREFVKIAVFAAAFDLFSRYFAQIGTHQLVAYGLDRGWPMPVNERLFVYAVYFDMFASLLFWLAWFGLAFRLIRLLDPAKGKA